MTTASTITASTFAYDYGYGDRRHDNTWTVGVLAHVAAACQGQKVTIEVDSMTGFTLCDVELIGVVPGYSGSWNLLVKSEGNTTGYLTFKIGTIVIHATGKHHGRFTVADLLREGRSAAIAAARELYAAAHPLNPEPYGKWDARPVTRVGEWSVEFTPQGQRQENGDLLVHDAATKTMRVNPAKRWHEMVTA